MPRTRKPKVDKKGRFKLKLKPGENDLGDFSSVPRSLNKRSASQCRGVFISRVAQTPPAASLKRRARQPAGENRFRCAVSSAGWPCWWPALACCRPVAAAASTPVRVPNIAHGEEIRKTARAAGGGAAPVEDESASSGDADRLGHSVRHFRVRRRRSQAGPDHRRQRSRSLRQASAVRRIGRSQTGGRTGQRRHLGPHAQSRRQSEVRGRGRARSGARQQKLPLRAPRLADAHQRQVGDQELRSGRT